MRQLPIWFLAFPSLAACGDKPDDPDPSDDTAAVDDTGSEPAASNGLPEGTTTWTGEGTAAGVVFPLEVELVNDGGDLTGTVTVSDPGIGIGTGIYGIEGTHAPASGAFALAPTAWIQSPDIEIELLGATGTYDADAGTLTGQLRDYASSSDNTLQGGAFTLTLASGGGAPSPVGDGARALPDSVTIAGQMRCTGDPRDVTGTLSHDGAGRVTGTLTLGNPGLDAPLGTFPVDGAHNPTTGAITLAPQPWSDPPPATLNFLVSGTWDPSDGA